MKLAPTTESSPVALAKLATVIGANEKTGDVVEVHFNPASLQLQLSNELKDTRNNERKQYVAKTAAKLTMQLLFDTTDTGTDVTITTRKLQAFLAPPMPEGDAARQQVPPPLVLFDWGTLQFKGIAATYRETIDFFSADGVPLRASVDLTLSRQDQVFDEPKDAVGAAGDSDQIGAVALPAPAGGAAAVASQLGAPSVARAIGAANGQASLRFGGGETLSVSAGVSLKAAAAFAPTAGVEIGLSTELGADVDLSAGLAPVARLAVSEGAFAGLQAPRVGRRTGRVDPAQLIPSAASATRSLDGAAAFRVGGRASLEGPSGLRADVGASTNLTFD